MVTKTGHRKMLEQLQADGMTTVSVTQAAAKRDCSTRSLAFRDPIHSRSAGTGTLLELFRAARPNPLKPAAGDGYPWPGVRNFSFEVDDMDRKIEEMGSDAAVTSKPLGFDDFIPGWRSAWLRDPAGNIIQITKGYTDQENPPPPPPA